MVEFLGRAVPDDGRAVAAGLQILSEGKELAGYATQIAERPDDVLCSLS